MDQDEYDDYLVEQAKELLQEDADRETPPAAHEQQQGGGEGWKRWEERFILQYHDTRTVQEIADEIGRQDDVVREKMEQFGLRD